MNATVENFTFEKRRFLENRNWTLTLLKNLETISLIKYSPVILLHLMYVLVFKNHRKATIEALLWNIKNIKVTMRKRRKIREIRKRSDKEILQVLSKN